MMFSRRISQAIMIVASTTFSTASATPKITTLKEGHIYNKTIRISLRGNEYRKSPDYPKDDTGRGFDANAKDNYLAKCAELETRLRKDLRSMLLSFRCAEARNVAVQSNRRQYQGIVTIIIDHEHIIFEEGKRIEGPLVKVNDFPTAAYKWQESRARARRAYKNACDDYMDQLVRNDPDPILLVDCGIVNEDNSKVGWRYFSTATVYKTTDRPVLENCGKGKLHDNTWWVVDAANPIRDTIDCRFGGRKEERYERVIELRCRNGRQVVTGAQKTGSFIGTVGSCLSPASCGSRSHKSSWWEQDGYTRESAQCRYGGDKIDVYEQMRKYSCFNGVISKTNSTKKGAHIRTEGRCSEQATEKRNCGGHVHGETWHERNVTQSDVRPCGRGGSKVVNKIQKIRYLCVDGVIVEKNRIIENDETGCSNQNGVDEDDHIKREQERRQHDREKAERELQQREQQAERERRNRQEAEREHRQRDREKAERERQQRERQAERERRNRQQAEQERRQRDRERVERERQQRERQAEREHRNRQQAERERRQRDRERAERERQQAEQEAERKRKKAERERQ